MYIYFFNFLNSKGKTICSVTPLCTDQDFSLTVVNNHQLICCSFISSTFSILFKLWSHPLDFFHGWFWTQYAGFKELSALFWDGYEFGNVKAVCRVKAEHVAEFQPSISTIPFGNSFAPPASWVSRKLYS